KAIPTDHPAFEEAERNTQAQIDRLLNVKGSRSVDYYHKKLGKITGDKCGMARNEQGLKEAIGEIEALREEFWQNVRVPGDQHELNPELEKAGRLADFLELAELMCMDALHRAVPSGGHCGEDAQSAEGEALGDDVHVSYGAGSEHGGDAG